MKVTLLTYTPEPEKIIASAAKICYSDSDAVHLLEGLTEEKTTSFVNMLATIGHESPIEHASFTFGIEGVSRTVLAQITRHRIASFSVQSQRYVKQNNFTFITPPEIEKDPAANEIYQKAMEYSINKYYELSDILEEKHYKNLIEHNIDEKTARKQAEKMAVEDARFVLPNSCETKMVATFNARSLLNFFSLRCCNRAQWEIRDLACQMLKLCYEVAPNIFKNAGPSCCNGKCKEGKMTCGKQEQVKEYIKMLKA